MQMKSFVKTGSFHAGDTATDCIIGATWKSNAPITYLAASSNSGTFQSVYTDTGVEAVCASAKPSIAIGLIGNNRDALLPWRFIKLQSGYTASTIAQVTAVDVAVVLKRA
jgi:hypothetical protein